MSTVLGSCVSVCLFAPEKKIGGINHFMLPFWNGDGLASPKFGNIAVEKLIEKMAQMGVGECELIAKIFGGADQLHNGGESIFKIGNKNILIAEQILNEHKIKIVVKNVGGNRGRKLIFNTHSGEVKMHLLNRPV